MSGADQTWYQWQGDELLLKLKLQTRASHDELIGPQLDYLKVCITAQPVDGQANTYLIKFLAGAFGVSKRSIAIEKGEKSRFKRIRIKKPKKLPIKADLNMRVQSRKNR